MKKIIIAMFLLSVYVLNAQSNHPPAGGYCLNATLGWIPIASSLGTASPTNPPPFNLYGLSAGKWYGLSCDTSGNLTPGSAAGGDLGGTYPNPTVNSVAHVTTGLLSIANQQTNPSVTLHVNSASDYAGTPDGTVQKPFVTLLQAFADMTETTSYVIIFDQGGSYTFPASTFPSTPTGLTLVCFGAVINVTGGNQSVPVPVTSYDCNVTGGSILYSTALPNIIRGGSISGNFTTGSGTTYYYDTVATGASTITVSAGAMIYTNHVNWTGHIVSGGAGAIFIADGSSNFNTSGFFSSNFNWNAGGQLIILDGSTLVDSGISPNASCADGATSSAPNVIGDNVSMNVGIQCGSAWTNISSTANVPSIYSGTNTYWLSSQPSVAANTTTGYVLCSKSINPPVFGICQGVVNAATGTCATCN